MSVNSISYTATHQATTHTVSWINWNEFECDTVQYFDASQGKMAEHQVLKGSLLSCSVNTKAEVWKNRQHFMEQVVADVVTHCPSDEPLAFISLGSDRLLVEYIIGATLAKRGFKILTFMLVDPAYMLSSPKSLETWRALIDCFGDKMNSLNEKGIKDFYPSIHCLRRSKGIEKCLTDKHPVKSPNVLLLESLPPYGERIKNFQKYRVEKKDPETLLLGSTVVPASEANSIVFIPLQLANQLREEKKIKHNVPITFFQEVSSSFYIDWGCKIYPDGRSHVSFSGYQEYTKLMGIQHTLVHLQSGKTVRGGELIPTLKKQVEEQLSRNIQQIQVDNPSHCLTQDQVTALLEKVQRIVLTYFPSMYSFFMADYMIDREEAIKAMRSKGNNHYRKNFKLIPDSQTDYCIEVSDI